MALRCTVDGIAGEMQKAASGLLAGPIGTPSGLPWAYGTHRRAEETSCITPRPVFLRKLLKTRTNPFCLLGRSDCDYCGTRQRIKKTS